MTRFRRAYRDVDGHRVEGTWRHIFVRNGDNYYLADLVIYADGAVDTGTGGLTDPDGLAGLLRSGQVATTLHDGAWASAHHLATWRFTEATCAIDADMLLGEVADEIDRLNDRPDSTDRCLRAVRTYLADATEDNRLRVRQRYLAIPEHLRIYALGDMDNRDWPLKVLATAIGDTVEGHYDDEVATPDLHAEAVEYFRDRELHRARAGARIPADGPDQPETATLTLYQGRQDHPDNAVLQNDYPARLTIDGRDYPTVTHAYWALATDDPGWRDRIAAAPDTYDAAELAGQAPRRPGWPAARLAIMARLLRTKFAQHPSMARVLLATGDARIVYTAVGSAYWTASGQRSSNWIGRLLELVRSELAALDAGVPLPTSHGAGPSAAPET
ncbi:NADAR family protein [Actinoplanes oblitus]|uniref:NADAR family protein n=1 Tax=Actinoplanes oblitus TaxID=3040509 RepID=A0ABY8WAS8_9ACTN|nr:NADAR family protein [Actinoplanes oblitus]WIM92820.1 NADAR family protein [Actinoplanes oblitus]